MTERWRCSNGHEWEAATQAVCLEAPSCPECGSPSICEPGADLPPFPRPVSLPPLPDLQRPSGDCTLIQESPVFPQIPGYEILEVLGRGGMGVVYKARQLGLDRLVALKVILAGAHASPEERARFRLEAEAVSRLQHLNIVQIYQIGEWRSTGGGPPLPFFSLEYVEGGTLARRINGTPQGTREAATLVEALARAVETAHEKGILHRDLKPANVLLAAGPDTALAGCVPKITDFGLAKHVEREARSVEGEEANGASRSVLCALTQTGAILGTPSYMAPEQAEGRTREIGPATDVYALGAILYELLTGRPPFKGETTLDTLEQVRAQEPVPPSRLSPRLPRDLSTICLKALAKVPARRYATAGGLADDLRRFLEGKTIEARPAGRVEKLGRWCRRNPVVAGLTAATGLLLLGLAVASLLAAVAARGREQEALARKRDQELESLMQRIQLLRERAHVNGWSAEAWGRVLEAARISRDSPSQTQRLQTEAAATLAGLDGRLEKRFEDHASSSVAFDATGKRLLFGGIRDPKGAAAFGAKLWDSTSNEIVHSMQVGPGPVAFASDGTPLQLVAPDKAGSSPGLLLWDVANQKMVSECKFDPQTNQLAVPGESTVMALSSDGSLVAASVPRRTLRPERAEEGARREGILAVWESRSGKRFFQHGGYARALAFSPDKAFLAAGDEHGRVTIWSLPQGKQVSEPFEVTRQAIHCLAFSPDGRLLAVGGSGGTLTIWDWRLKRLEGDCRGSMWDVYAVTFSPDGATLASAGRYSAKLWDVATGRLLLDLHGSDFATGLAFAADAGQLAVSSKTVFAQGEVRIWKLEYGRGIQTLRGPSTRVARVCFSQDGKLLAGLSQDWQVAIWEVGSGRRKLLLTVPRGSTADNAALAFSPNSHRLAFATLITAQLWDLDTGKEIRTWKLPRGYQDTLAFHPSGKLLLFRCETHEKKPLCRVRDLLRPNWSDPIAQVSTFDQDVLSIAAPADGGYFVVDGVASSAAPGSSRRASECERPSRLLGAFDGMSGKKLWLMSIDRSLSAHATPIPDPTGTVMAFNEDKVSTLVEMPSGRRLDSSGHEWGGALSPAGDYFATLRKESESLCLFRRGDGTPLVVFPLTGSPVFSRDGRLLAGGNPDGSASVYDLTQVRQRLTQADLGW